MPPLQITITGTQKDISKFLNQSEIKGSNRIIINGVTFCVANLDRLAAFPGEVYVNLELTEVKEFKS